LIFNKYKNKSVFLKKKKLIINFFKQPIRNYIYFLNIYLINTNKSILNKNKIKFNRLNLNFINIQQFTNLNKKKII